MARRTRTQAAPSVGQGYRLEKDGKVQVVNTAAEKVKLTWAGWKSADTDQAVVEPDVDPS